MNYLNISAVFPAYNEEKNLEELIIRVDQALKKYFTIYEIIVVDDGSKDNSVNVLKKLQKKYSHLVIIVNEKNLGYGSALKKGLCAARYELIFFSDADNQFDLNEIGLLLSKIDENDAVIGFRKNRKDGAYRKINAWIWNTLNFIFYKITIKDIDCAFKLFTKKILDTIDVSSLSSTSPMINSEIIIKLKKRSAKIKQIPITHFSRKKGISRGGGIRMITNSIYDFFRLYKHLK